MEAERLARLEEMQLKKQEQVHLMLNYIVLPVNPVNKIFKIFPVFYFVPDLGSKVQEGEA